MPARFSFLPADLGRWDTAPGGDAIVVPIWTDVRPLRGPAGLLDWRLCGRLSQVIGDGRLSGAAGEKLLLVTSRLRWRRVLVIGLGDSTAFSPEAARAAIDCALQALRGIGASSVAIALPGRDKELIPADEAFRLLVEAITDAERSNGGSGAWLDSVAVIDAPAAAKMIGHNLPSAPQAASNLAFTRL